MVKPALRTRSMKRVKKRLPGGKTVMHFRKKKLNYHHCGKCGAKLNRERLRKNPLRKLPKVQRRPSRPLPELCSRCMRAHFCAKARGI